MAYQKPKLIKKLNGGCLDLSSALAGVIGDSKIFV